MSVRAKKPKSRRGRHEGSVYQRGDKRWAAVISAGKDANGKRKRKNVYGATKQAVLEKLEHHRRRARPGRRPVEKTKITVAEHLQNWLDYLPTQNTLTASTIVNYGRNVRLHIAPRLGTMLLQDVTDEAIAWLAEEMVRDKVGPGPRRLAHVVLSLAFKRARRQRLVEINPFASGEIDKPGIPDAKTDWLNKAETGALLRAAAGDRLEALYHMAIGTGMRSGELFGLHWSAVDLAAGTVSVCQSLSELGGKLFLTPPKSKKSRRLIDMPQHAKTALEAHQRRQLAAGHIGAGFVFTNASGGALRRSHVGADSYKPLLKRAGLRSIRFHDLRHTHATLCLLAGENPLSVSQRLGHSSVNLTLDRYSHVLPSVKTDAAIKWDSIIGEAIAENGCQLAVKSA